jgi:hypothetical protein
MKVTMLLADAAQAVEGKLFVLGGGWSVTGPQPVPSGIAIKIEVPWNDANRNHSWELVLTDADGRPVEAPTPAGVQQVRVNGNFEVGRPPGVMEGTPLDGPLAINFGPIPLPPASRFMWRLWIDGNTSDEWFVAFSTRAIPPGMQIQMPPQPQQ